MAATEAEAAEAAARLGQLEEKLALRKRQFYLLLRTLQEIRESLDGSPIQGGILALFSSWLPMPGAMDIEEGTPPPPAASKELRPLPSDTKDSIKSES